MPDGADALELLVDGSALGDDSAYRGIGTYMRELLAAVAVSEGVSVTALIRDGTRLPAGVRPAPLRRVAPGRWRPREHELRLPGDLRRHPADVFHSPALDPPRHCPMPWIQTLHDVIPLVFDSPDLKVERRRWLRHAPRYRRAAATVAVSRHTAEVGIAKLGLDPRRVEVIHHGVGTAFGPPASRPQRDDPYLLMVSEYSRRKGYPEAFAAIGALADRGYPHRLRVTGRIAPWLRGTVDDVVAAAPRSERIELLGFVDDLVAAYQGADALLVPSRYEGFGLPVLEAMACGTPVIAFDNSSLTEIVGDAGLLVPDGDALALAAAARRILDNAALRDELSERGIERARQFSWADSAAAHLALYGTIAARG